MAESLKIIHVCDHIIREDFEENRQVLLNRQEIREDEVIDCEDRRLIYNGSWELMKASSDTKCMETFTPGDRLTMHFYGDNIKIYSRKVPDGGKVKVFLDGDELGVIDLYSENIIRKEPIISVDNLIYGMHTVKIQLLDTKNELSTGKTFLIESAMIQDAIITELSPFDVVAIGETVKSINSVYQTIDDETTYFSEGDDYIIQGGGKIKWISVNRPNPDYKYVVNYVRKFSKMTTYKSKTCPRCYGLGWYGAFNDLTTGLPSKTTGIYKIAEDIIKIILTPLREDGYGSEFHEMNKSLYVDAASVEELAMSEINRIERYYKSLQSSEITKGATYTSEDTLYAIIVNNASFNTGTYTLNLELTIYNNVGQSHDAQINI